MRNSDWSSDVCSSDLPEIPADGGSSCACAGSLMEKRLPGFQDYRFRLRGNMPAEARLSAELQRMNKNDRGVSIRELILLGAQVKERLGSPISTTPIGRAHV